LKYSERTAAPFLAWPWLTLLRFVEALCEF
jgi:hypothetical protein